MLSTKKPSESSWSTWADQMLADALQEARRRKTEQEQSRQALEQKRAQWPVRHMVGTDGKPAPFHRAQELAFDSQRRIVAMLAGSQSGKTAFGPWWLDQEIQKRGGGDYIVATSSFDLFKLKLLPVMREVYESILGVARYWSGDRVLELRNPETGEFMAKRADDRMWARIILRSAESTGGLESTTAKGAWLDEAGQDSFELDAWRAIRRRITLHRGRVLITTTLYNLGWLKQQVIDRAVEGGTVAIDNLPNGAEIELTDNAASDIALIQFDSIANPVFPLDEYAQAEATMPADEFAMFYRGRVTKMRSLIYDCFDRRKNTCPRFSIPDKWKRYLGLDFGGVNTAGVFFAEEPGAGRLFGYREYLSGGRTAKDHAVEMLKGEPMTPVCVGGSKSEGQWRQEFRAGGLPVRAPEIADVNVGIGRVYGKIKQAELIFFDDLEGTLDQIGSYKRKRNKSGEITEEIEHKDTYHYLDAVRYIIGWANSGRKVGAGWL